MFLSPTSASERMTLAYPRTLTADHLSCPRAVGMPLQVEGSGDVPQARCACRLHLRI